MTDPVDSALISFSELTLDTPRLWLRPLLEVDAAPLYGIYSDPQVMRYWNTKPWPGPDKALEVITSDAEELARGHYLRLGILRKDDNALIGTCSLFNFSAQSKRAEIGYILSRSAWGSGYMNEALHTLVDYAFTELDLHRIEAEIDPRNSASQKSLIRLGFVHEGNLRERWIVEGEISDSGLYGLLRRDWIALNT